MRTVIAQKLRQALVADALDAAITSSPENFAYVMGFVVPTQPMIRHRHAMVVLTADGNDFLFGVDMEASTIERSAGGLPLTVWREFHDDAMKVLADALTRAGLANSRIGMEMDYLPAGDFQRLAGYLPNATFVHFEQQLNRARQIKTPEEVALIHRLSRIADQAIADSFGAVRAGDTELDIAAVLTRRIYELGAENFKLLIVATGERSQLPNVGPTSRKLQPRDICRVEIFSLLNGYQAGVCRTAYVEEPPAMATEIWDLMVECKYAILEQIKPGASCLAIYNDFIRRLAGMNLPPISFVGHGIGLHLHEDPYIGATPILGQPGKDAVVEENMVLGFEPLCYRTGYGFGVQNKDVLHVTATGSVLLSDFTDTDKLIRIGA
ncbi:M24 family metallopeptidase [Ancylobacter oerskovii]|uniref:M24 family metallopeptidase n=1 Tax=Ancylobacter oerskovii TaxID=459519 RepID=A0ABW4YUN9_9HYPH|nr:Xaa-Pro peptidase family protein [Ancylobacter oerskovii]MBS7544617.1 aminopeptidase P family protein [Ancylobacter oerskovii]